MFSNTDQSQSDAARSGLDQIRRRPPPILASIDSSKAAKDFRITSIADSGIRYLPELDGLRAIAVFLVITAHEPNILFERLDGRLGVAIFFVLSGYLITLIALREEKNKGKLSLPSFYTRRTFRIFPLYYFTLGLYFFLIIVLHFSPTKKTALVQAMPYYLMYLQEIPFFGKDIYQELPFYQSWSLGIEEKFYLVWPVLCFSFLRYRRHFRIPLILLLAVASAFTPYTRPYIIILFGCLLALALERKSFERALQRIGSVGTWLSFGLLLVFQCTVMPWWKWTFANHVYSAWFTVFLALLVSGQSDLKRYLGYPVLVYIGKISYGIYLIHILCIGAVRDNLHFGNSLSGFVLVCALSIAIATAMHYFLEKPLIEVGRRLSAKCSH
jgi:peptidoglycan/LPS O-acetylase OafA/YrhL